MTHVQRLVLMLHSDNSNTRGDACMQRAAASSLPAEAVVALRLATEDSSALVASAAPRALAGHANAPVPPSPQASSRPSDTEVTPKSSPSSSRAPSWKMWALASLVGLALARLLTPFLLVAIHGVPDSASFTRLDEGLIDALRGYILGTIQWLVLPASVPKASWWVVATTMGCAIGGYVSTFIPGELPSLLLYATIITAAQWLYLRSRFPRSLWWWLASPAGWTLALGIFTVAYLPLIGDLLAGTLYAAVTAPSIAVMFRHSSPIQPLPEADARVPEAPDGTALKRNLVSWSSGVLTPLTAGSILPYVFGTFGIYHFAYIDPVTELAGNLLCGMPGVLLLSTVLSFRAMLRAHRRKIPRLFFATAATVSLILALPSFGDTLTKAFLLISALLFAALAAAAPKVRSSPPKQPPPPQSHYSEPDTAPSRRRASLPISSPNDSPPHHDSLQLIPPAAL